MAWNDSSPDKKVEKAISIDITYRQGPGARELAEHAFTAHVALQIVNADRAPIGEAILVVTRTGQQRPLQAKHGGLGTRDSSSQGGVGHQSEPAASVIAIQGQLASGTGSNRQVIPPVMINIVPGNAGTELAQFIRQERLSRKVIERQLVMFVLEQPAHVFEEWLVGRSRPPACRWFARGPLVDLLNEIRLNVRNRASLAAPPDYSERHPVGK